MEYTHSTHLPEDKQMQEFIKLVNQKFKRPVSHSLRRAENPTQYISLIQKILRRIP